jgi:hypothetical protein
MMMKRVALAFLFLVASAVQGAQASSLLACMQEKTRNYRNQLPSTTPHDRALMALSECSSKLDELADSKFHEDFPRLNRPDRLTLRIENIQKMSLRNQLRDYYVGYAILNISNGSWN